MRLEGRDVLKPGDAMTVWIDPVTWMTRRVEIRTRVEEDPVSLSADYRMTVNGPTYQARGGGADARLGG